MSEIKKRIIPIVNILVIIIQFVLIAIDFWLEDLTDSSIGVNHSLRFRKTNILHNYFTDSVLMILTLLVAVLVIIFIIKLIKNRRGLGTDISNVLIIFWGIMTLIFTNLPYFKETLIYPFLIIVGLVNIGLSVLMHIMSRQIYK